MILNGGLLIQVCLSHHINVNKEAEDDIKWWLIDPSMSTSHHINVNKEAEDDIKWWLGTDNL